MNYPVNCKRCNQPLYGPVKYCPFCGTASISVSDIPDRTNQDALRAEIISSLKQGEYTPSIRGNIKRKGEKTGTTEEACNSLLLEVLKGNEFSRIDEECADPLEVAWYSAEKRKLKENAPQQPESAAIKKVLPEQAEPEKVIPQVPTSAGRPKTTPPSTHTHHHPPPKHLFGKVVLVLGTVAILGGLLYAKRGMIEPPILNKVEQPGKIKGERAEPTNPLIKQGESRQPAAANLKTERKKIRKEAEIEALAKIKADEKMQEQLIKQKERATIAKFVAKTQRQEQEAKQREIDDYLTEGKQFFENAKYELCIEKMKEVIKRDNSNREAKQYIRMASNKINTIRQEWSHPNFGGSE